MDCEANNNEEKLNKILVVVGPSGVGKDTVMQKFLINILVFLKKE